MKPKNLMSSAGILFLLAFTITPVFADETTEIYSGNSGTVKNNVTMYAGTGDNNATSNGHAGDITTGDAGIESVVRTELNTNEVEVDLTNAPQSTTSGRRRHHSQNQDNEVNVTAVNESSVENNGYYEAYTGGNNADNNGGEAIEEESSLTTEEALDKTNSEFDSEYYNSDSCPSQSCHRHFGSTPANVTEKSQSSSESTLSKSSSVAQAYKLKVTPVGGGKIATGTTGVASEVTTILNSSVVKFTRN